MEVSCLSVGVRYMETFVFYQLTFYGNYETHKRKWENKKISWAEGVNALNFVHNVLEVTGGGTVHLSRYTSK